MYATATAAISATRHEQRINTNPVAGGERMITSLQLANFKNFADESLRMGPFTVIVGANASGKSNIRDAFRFLHGIGRGYSLSEIVGGKYGVGGQVEWEAIRGSTNEIVRLGHSEFWLKVNLIVPRIIPSTASYEIGVGVDNVVDNGLLVTREQLRIGEGEPLDLVFDVPNQGVGESLRVDLYGLAGESASLMVRNNQPAFSQIGKNKKADDFNRLRVAHVLDLLGKVGDGRFLDLSPNSIRRPAFPGQTVLGDRGENLPTVLRETCRDTGRRETLLEWTRELTPMDVVDFEFPPDPAGRIHLAFREASGRTVSAYSASDGTLRFLALLAALLGTNPAGLYVFEEIDSGIHPSRLHLLLDLIEQQTAKGHLQVVTTTHSPELLSMISDKTFEHTSVVCRRPDTDDAVIRPIAELPNANELRKSQGLGRLHTGGWLETAAWFSESKTGNLGSEA